MSIIKNFRKKEVGNIIQELGWELTLANSNNKISENYKIELQAIDQYRQIDARIYKYYENMINEILGDGITNIWPQSAYRSLEYQKEVFNKKVEYYEKHGMTTKIAKIKTEKLIMKPGCSNHNLGLAIDFNYVNKGFENSQVFKWL